VTWDGVTPEEQIERLAKVPLAAVEPSTGQPIKLVDVTVAPKNDAGGAGSASTTGDYARFCQMLLNGGQLDGTRLLSPTTVAFMTSDHLGPMKIVPLGGVGTGYGFGLGFAVRTAPGIAATSGSVGEYRWGGAAGTAFWVDPKEEMITVLMTQGAPGPARGYTGALFRQMVRQAIIE
jgi:CubicO group peptidase (beta-lactamase class C family)